MEIRGNRLQRVAAAVGPCGEGLRQAREVAIQGYAAGLAGFVEVADGNRRGELRRRRQQC